MIFAFMVDNVKERQRHRKHLGITYLTKLTINFFPGVTQPLLIPETFFQWLVTIDQWFECLCFKIGPEQAGYRRSFSSETEAIVS